MYNNNILPGTLYLPISKKDKSFAIVTRVMSNLIHLQWFVYIYDKYEIIITEYSAAKFPAYMISSGYIAWN